MGKMPYVQPRLKAISLDAEEMICVSVDAGVNPDDFDMGAGGYRFRAVEHRTATHCQDHIDL